MAKTKSKKKVTETDSESFGEELTKTIDDIYVEEITSGKFFEKSFDDHIVRFSPDMILKLMDRIDSYSHQDLIIDFGLDKGIVFSWLKDYWIFHSKFTSISLQSLPPVESC